MKEIKFAGYKNYPINLYIWDEVDKPKCVVQLVHGMVEHLGRYDEFARFLNSKGYIVLGDDHRAHGKTSGKADLGKTPEGDCYWDTVEDLKLITDYAKEQYNLPIVLFGHSYGSFLSQGYIQSASDKLTACVLCGSAFQDGADVKAGRLVANIQATLIGKDKPAKFIKKLSFDAYDKQFDPPVPFAWGNRDDAERQKYLDDEYCNYVCSIGFYQSFFNALKVICKQENIDKIKKDLPIFIISGDKDPVGKYGESVNKLYGKYKESGIENVTIKLYSGARHEILNEINKQEVFDDVLSFLDKCNR